MARTVRDAKLDSRTAREKLKVSGKPYYRAIDEGLHLGYRKGKRGGKWVARFYAGDRNYKVETIAPADDHSDADGVHVLSFGQAQARAREMLATFRQHEDGEQPRGGKFTVADAMADYLSFLEHESKSADDARYRIEALIKPELGNVECTRLTAKRLRDWLAKVADTPARLRTKKGAETQQYRELNADDPEQVRRRRSTANRTLTVLKAGLNHAYREGKIPSDAAWRRVTPFREADTARTRYLDAKEITRLLNAAPHDLRRLINAALFTGARYGELAALKVRDFHPDSGTLYVGQSKSGKSRHIVLTEAGQKFFAQITQGRGGDDTVLVKDDGQPWKKSHQTRPLNEACEAGKIDPAASFHTIRHTYASHLVMAGVPLMVVAKNLGHSDTRMVEKHYGHLAASYVADTIRKMAPDLGQVEESNVAAL